MATQMRIVNKGQKWDPANTPTKAGERRRYVKTSGGDLILSGAPARWAKPEHSRDIYVRDLRLVGTPEEISALLRQTGISDEEIQRFIANSYSAENYKTTMRDAFQAELRDIEEFKRIKKAEKPAPKVLLERDLPLIYAAFKGGKAATGGVTATAAPRGAGKGGRGPPLLQRILNIDQGKVIDCSHMTEAGTGCKAITAPGPNSKKRGVPGLPLVSDNLETYRRAVEQLGSEYAGYIDQYQQQMIRPVTVTTATGLIGVPAARATSPVRTSPRAVSPRSASPVRAGVPTMQVPTLQTMQVPTLQTQATVPTLTGLPTFGRIGSPSQ